MEEGGALGHGRENNQQSREHHDRGGRRRRGGDKYNQRDNRDGVNNPRSSDRGLSRPLKDGDERRGESRGNSNLTPGEARDHGDGRRVQKPQKFQAQRRGRYREQDGDNEQGRSGARAANRQQMNRNSRHGVIQTFSDEEMEDHGPIVFEPVGGQELKPEVHKTQGEDEDDMEYVMRVMGFAGFRSSKGKQVPGNSRNYGVHVTRTRTYRQYMNRSEGFNRPLDSI